jgi:hypothetical protein
MKKAIITLGAFCILMRAYADLTNGLVASYPFAGSLTNQINPQQVASLLNGAELQSNFVAMTNAPGAIQVPAPFSTTNSIFTASIQVFEAGITEATGGAYLTAGSGGTSVLLLTHLWVNITQNPEGSYYGAVQPAGPMTNEFLAPLQTSSIQSRWVHYVLVSDTNEVSLYKDSVKIGVMNTSGVRVSGDWFIGRHWWLDGGANLNSAERILGFFKNLKVYSRALSGPEVQQVYQDDTGIHVSFVKAFTVDASGLIAGSNYQLQASSDLVSWTNFDLPFTATSVSYTNTNYQRISDWGKLYFRLQGLP